MPENESRKHVLTPSMVDRTSLQTIIYHAILTALTRRDFTTSRAFFVSARDHN